MLYLRESDFWLLIQTEKKSCSGQIKQAHGRILTHISTSDLELPNSVCFLFSYKAFPYPGIGGNVLLVWFGLFLSMALGVGHREHIEEG